MDNFAIYYSHLGKQGSSSRQALTSKEVDQRPEELQLHREPGWLFQTYYFQGIKDNRSKLSLMCNYLLIERSKKYQ